MSIVNILIYVLGGITAFIVAFFEIKKFKKWKKLAKEFYAKGQDEETAKANAYKEVYKKKKKNKQKEQEKEDTPFIE